MARVERFAVIAELEPSVLDMYERARLGGWPSRNRLWQEYEDCKRKLSMLVGWQAEREELRDSVSYDAAILTILGGLEAREAEYE